MPDRNWYYSRGGQQQGPVKTAQLKQLVAAGEVGPSDLVWTETMTNWAAASTVKGLFPAEAEDAGYTVEPLAETSPGSPVPSTTHETAEAKPMSEPATSYSPQFKAATQLAGEAGRNAWRAIKSLVSNPVGSMGQAYGQLSSGVALQVGAAFIVASLLLFLVAELIGDTWLLGIVMMTSRGLSGFLKSLILLLAMAGAMVGVAAGFRMLARSSAGIAADLFIVGAALLPIGLATLLASLLNLDSRLVSAIVLAAIAFATAFSVLMLYSGLLQIARLSDRLASLAAPSIFAVAAMAMLIVGWLFW